MFNNCVKSVIKWRPLSQCYSFTFLENGHRNYASFKVKDILYETSDESGTLLTRFAKHVAIERLSVCELVPTEVRYSDYFPITDMKYLERQLGKTPANQLASVIVYASSYRANADPPKFAAILNELDRYAVQKLDEMNVDAILRTLYAFLFAIPNWMTRLDFYAAAMQKLFSMVQEDGCTSKALFVQMSFYFGLSKKQSRVSLNKLWKTFLDSNLDRFLPELSALDLALVSNAAFKTSTSISSDDFNNRLTKEVLEISSGEGGADALMISFIKSLRLQRVQSKEICEHLTHICRSPINLQQFQARGQVHIFAYLAENHWDNEECTQPIIKQFLQSLETSNDTRYVDTVRGKDISTFLWCCAQLKCNITNEQLRVVEKTLLKKAHNGEFDYYMDQLVESCLWLWTLGCRSKELLQFAIQLKSESQSKRQQPKVDSRFTVLVSAAQIEEPTWCSNLVKGFTSFNLKAKVPDYLLNSEIPYQELISQLKGDSMVSSANICSPINGINIPGILVKLATSSDSHLFVEFMTKSQTLKFSQEPVGILRLKLQLLQSMGHKVKVLTSDEFTNPLKLSDILHEEHNGELSENRIKA